MASGGGLRAENKRKTRLEIIGNAIALFEKHGIRRTRTSEIARNSGVSAGTLFNYFPTKDALVEAWLRGELEATLREAASSLGDRGLRPMLRQVCRAVAEDYVELRDLRAEGWGILGRGRSADFLLDGASPLVRVVRAEQERDRVRKDLRPVALAEVLIDGLEGGLVAVLAPDAAQGDRGPIEAAAADASAASLTIARSLEGRVELILDGMRKRNERVSAPASYRPGSDRPATRTQK